MSKAPKPAKAGRKKSLFVQKIHCPYCFELVHPGDCPIVCGRDGAVLEAAPKGMQRLRSRFRIKPLTGPIYTQVQARRQCPNPRCLKLWPTAYELTENHIIAILGSHGAGVTTSHAVLIHELRQSRVLQAIGATAFSPIDDDTERHYSVYESLYQEKRVFQGTVPAQLKGGVDDPLIFQLHFPASSGRKQARTVNLFFYDPATEDVQEEAKLVEFVRFIFHASAMLLLADPLGVPAFKKAIDPIHHYLISGERPENFFSRVIRIYERYHGGQPIALPLAITVPKSDFLEAFDPGRRSIFFAKPAYEDPAAPKRRWLEEFEKVGQDVQRLLTTTGETALLLWGNHQKRVSYFATALTGHPPTPGTADYPAIEPIRVLEPLLWILWQLGVIEIK
jgi:hypothetical protein